LRRIQDYPRLLEYLRELYQWRGIKETFDLEKIKAGYYSQRNINPTGIVPIGPELAYLEQPHQRGSDVSI
jgi:putative glutathione S-transferase